MVAVVKARILTSCALAISNLIEFEGTDSFNSGPFNSL